MRRHSMTRRSSLFLAFLCLLAGSLFSHAAIAAERVAPEASGPASAAPPAAKLPAIPENAEEIEALKGQPQTGTIVTRRPTLALSPMMAEIFSYMDARDLLLEAKRQQYATAKSDPAAAMTLQTEMQKLKFETEIEVLRIQVRWATKEGRTADALALEASIEERLNPKVTLAPEKRPAPSPAVGR